MNKLLIACGITLLSFVFLTARPVSADAVDHFVTTWDTENPGDSNSSSITIPVVGGPYSVDWDDDGTMDETGLYDSVSHDFGEPGEYTVNLEGLTQIRFANSGDVQKLIEISQWGTSAWTSMDQAFYGASNLVITATDIPNFTNVTSMNSMFYGATSANPVTTDWDTSSVTSFYDMFLGATSANPDTSGWDTGSATDMTGMFNGATSANPATTSWDVSNVEYFTGMFNGATSANPDVEYWETTSAIDMEAMFADATSATPATWNWVTSTVTNMRAMFNNASAADPAVSSWDTSMVTDMTAMFRDATSANPDVADWDVSNVTHMPRMFMGATSASPDLSNWNVSSVVDMEDMLEGLILSHTMYDSMLISWSQQEIQSDVVFDAGETFYCYGADAREILTRDYGWAITDGGVYCSFDYGKFALSADVTTTTTNTPVSITASALNYDDSANEEYLGTVAVTTYPTTATVPDNYTYTLEDAGVVTLGDITFSDTGTYTITVKDVDDIIVRGTIEVVVTNATVDYSTYSSSFVVPTSYKHYGVPYDISVLDDGSLWYINKRDRQVVKLSSTGAILRTIGRSGNGEGEFANDLVGLTIDDVGNIYALDHCKVSKLDSNGGFIKAFGQCGDEANTDLSGARGIVYSDYHDEILVADTNHDRVVRFGKNGEYLGEFGDTSLFDGPAGLDVAQDGRVVVISADTASATILDPEFGFVASIGSADSEDADYFDAPSDALFLSDGRIAVSSQNSYEIKIFDSSYEHLATWGGRGTEDGKFISPHYLTQDSDDNIWITDWGVNRIVVLSESGEFVKSYKNNDDADGMFDSPFSVATDSDGNVYVLDWLSDQGRVQMFSSTGSLIRTVVDPGQTGISFYHVAVDNMDNVYVSHAGGVRIFDTTGELVEEISGSFGDIEINQARGMGFDSAYERMYLADTDNNRVLIFDITGETASYVDYFSFTNESVGNVVYPEHIYVDHDDNGVVYVSGIAENDIGDGESNTRIIAKFDRDGWFIEYFDFWQDGDTGYQEISGLFLDSEGSIMISDDINNRIQIYDNDGNFRYSIGRTGGALNEFDQIMGAIVHPTTGEIIVVDSQNHRVHFLTEGVHIRNLIPSIDVLDRTGGQSLANNLLPLPGEQNINSIMKFGNYPVSGFSVDLSSSRDWSLVNAIILPDESKSLIVNLNPSDAEGVSETHSLYVVKQDGQSFVHICPSATLIADVNLSCEGGYNLTEEDENVVVETIDDVSYWVVSGLTGTGGMGGSQEDGNQEQAPTNAAQSGSASSSQASSSSSCTDTRPTKAPDLFQIDTTSETAKLFFTPIANTSDFVISFSTSTIAEEHGAEITLGQDGVQFFVVNYLKPSTTYYFKVRGKNGCASGEWSETLSATTTGARASSTRSFYKHQTMSKIVKLGPSPVVATPKTMDVLEDASVPTEQVSATPQPQAEPESEKKKFCLLWWCW